MSTKEVNIIVSSDPNNGASSLSLDGSQFSVQLNEPLVFPKESKNIRLSVPEAEIWWTIPNIITGINDTIRIEGPDVGDVIQVYDIIVPQGLYNLAAINSRVLDDLKNQGAKFEPDPLISFAEDNATNRVEIIFNYDTVSVDFTIPNTFREILGFNNLEYGPYPIVPQTVLADNVAAFNQVNYFLIHSDLVNRGLLFNNAYSQIVTKVQIDKAPGSQIVSTPFNPAKSDAASLAGTQKSSLRFWLTDDKNRPINTNGEYWGARILITYDTFERSVNAP
jgi:hypothetical protein